MLSSPRKARIEMMQYQRFMAAAVILLSATITLADDKTPPLQEAAPPAGTAPAENKWELQDGPSGPVLKEVEDIRKQLGPEYSIESKELGIQRDRDSTNSPSADKPGEEWNESKLYQHIRGLVSKFRQDARHLEELAAHAEQLSEFALADQLREMAHRQWEAARELSQPRSTRHYQEPQRPVSSPPQTPPQSAKSTEWEYGPSNLNTPNADSSSESAVPYGVPSAPRQRFDTPNEPERRKR